VLWDLTKVRLVLNREVPEILRYGGGGRNLPRRSLEEQTQGGPDTGTRRGRGKRCIPDGGRLKGDLTVPMTSIVHEMKCVSENLNGPVTPLPGIVTWVGKAITFIRFCGCTTRV